MIIYDRDYDMYNYTINALRKKQINVNVITLNKAGMFSKLYTPLKSIQNYEDIDLFINSLFDIKDEDDLYTKLYSILFKVGVKYAKMNNLEIEEAFKFCENIKTLNDLENLINTYSKIDEYMYNNLVFFNDLMFSENFLLSNIEALLEFKENVNKNYDISNICFENIIDIKKLRTIPTVLFIENIGIEEIDLRTSLLDFILKSLHNNPQGLFVDVFIDNFEDFNYLKNLDIYLDNCNSNNYNICLGIAHLDNLFAAKKPYFYDNFLSSIKNKLLTNVSIVNSSFSSDYYHLDDVEYILLGKILINKQFDWIILKNRDIIITRNKGSKINIKFI